MKTMMTMSSIFRIFLLFFLSFNISNLTGQTNQIDRLTGEWHCYKKELKNGETGENTNLDGKPYKPNMKLTFSKQKLIMDIANGKLIREGKYTVKNNILSFDNKEYLIEGITEKELILLELGSDSLLGDEFNFRRYFKKI